MKRFLAFLLAGLLIWAGPALADPTVILSSTAQTSTTSTTYTATGSCAAGKIATAYTDISATDTATGLADSATNTWVKAAPQATQVAPNGTSHLQSWTSTNANGITTSTTLTLSYSGAASTTPYIYAWCHPDAASLETANHLQASAAASTTVATATITATTVPDRIFVMIFSLRADSLASAPAGWTKGASLLIGNVGFQPYYMTATQSATSLPFSTTQTVSAAYGYDVSLMPEAAAGGTNHNQSLLMSGVGGH